MHCVTLIIDFSIKPWDKNNSTFFSTFEFDVALYIENNEAFIYVKYGCIVLFQIHNTALRKMCTLLAWVERDISLYIYMAVILPFEEEQTAYFF